MASLAGGNLAGGIFVVISIKEVAEFQSYGDCKLTRMASSCFAITSARSFMSKAILQGSKGSKMMKTSNLLLRTPGLIACHGLLVLLLSSISTSSNQALLPRSLVRSISPLLFSLLAQLTLGGDGLWREQVNYRKFTSTYFSSCLPASAQPWWQPSPLVQRILASERGRIQGC